MGVAQRKADDVLRFDGEIRARCPSVLIAAAEKAAAKSLMSQSEYIRRSVIDRLRIDGFDPTGAAV
jgi:uncharacterized protein YciI